MRTFNSGLLASTMLAATASAQPVLHNVIPFVAD